MILDRIENSEQYDCLSEKFRYAFNWMRQFSPADFEKGKMPCENGVWFNQFEYETKPFETAKMETHKKYADIMFMADGEEFLLYKPAKDLKAPFFPYEEEKDAALFTADPDALWIPLRTGMFVVFFPEDGHGSGVMMNLSKTVRRIVIKVPLD